MQVRITKFWCPIAQQGDYITVMYPIPFNKDEKARGKDLNTFTIQKCELKRYFYSDSDITNWTQSSKQYTTPHKCIQLLMCPLNF